VRRPVVRDTGRRQIDLPLEAVHQQ
jgi:hypothetical protein